MFRDIAGCTKAAVLLVLILVSFAGCSAPGGAGLPQASQSPICTPAPETTSMQAVRTLTNVTTTFIALTVSQPATATTATPVPPPSELAEPAINARIVDARNRLSNLIDSNVADTIIIHQDGAQDCEVKESRELGYLIDTSTGESTFIRGDYWSIGVDRFTDIMRQDHRYIIIHTHPKVWETCGGTGIFSFNTFSIEDLTVTANLTRQGFHVRELIAIADNEYRIRPGEEDGWKSRAEILVAIRQIESRTGQKYSHYSSLQNREIYDLDNLMPLLARELGYHYRVNSIVIS